MSSVETLMRELETEMPKRYAYDEILTFTSNFSDKIGSGGISEVYKGQFPNGVKVAVRVFIVNDDDIEDTLEAEVMTLGTIYHRSLVKLYGFCSENNFKALVYEFMENGSLGSILYRKSGIIEWHQKYNIAVEIAKALAYLHHGCHDQIIHNDVHPGNILLDANFSAKLTDFGLANLMEGSKNDTNIRGTVGYMAPEVYMQSIPRTFKCDVYSFGMSLFEILGRRRNFGEKTWFPKIVWNKFENKEFDEIIGDCGIRDVERKKATILAMVALWCVQYTPETRPSMSTVATVLEKEMHVNMPPDPISPSDPGISMHPEMNNPQGDSSTSDQSFAHLRVDMQQIFNSVKEQESQLTPEILGVEGSNPTHTNIILPGPKKLTPDIQGRRDDGNEKKGEKFLAYVEKKRSVTNEVCGSILAKMEELQINCDTDTFEEEKKLEESHRYVEMKQSVTNEVCESILKIMKEV